MHYSFDDMSFGLTEDGTKIDKRLASRPRGLTNQDWYKFAAELIRALEQR